MTAFANPAGTATGNTAAYREAVLAMLGERDPVVVLSELPEWLARRTRGLDDTRARRPEQPGKWSVVEVVAHLTDAELVHSYRTRMVVAEQEPPATTRTAGPSSSTMPPPTWPPPWRS